MVHSLIVLICSFCTCDSHYRPFPFMSNCCYTLYMYLYPDKSYNLVLLILRVTVDILARIALETARVLPTQISQAKTR
jgi:hypothetical protein